MMDAQSTHDRALQQVGTNHTDEDDAQAVYRTLHGESEAFSIIVRSYTPLFYSLISRMGIAGSQEDIEDNLQEIFLRMYRALPSYDTKRPFFTWAYTVALNWIRSQRRSMKSRSLVRKVVYDEQNALLQGTDHSAQPEQTLLAQEADRMLAEAVRSLRRPYREVFVLRMMQELSVTDTARIMKIPEGTVKTYLYRAKEELQAWFSSRQWSAYE